MSKKIRPLGHILLDLEPLIQEAMDSHDLQWSDWLGLNYLYLQTHYPDKVETYTSDGSHPVFFYGPKESSPKGRNLICQKPKKQKKR